MSKLLTTTMLAGALALAALCSPATAASSLRDNGVSNSAVQTAATEDVSARTRGRTVRRYRAVRTYRAPAYYGYYGPTYYERPYSRPAPFFFGLGGHW
jgi:hypothetical protein